MTAITVGYWPLMGGAVLACAIGFGFGILAMWVPRDPGPGEAHVSPPEVRSPLPRAGSFPTEPLSLLTEHQAQMAAYRRDLDKMNAAAEVLFPPEGGWPR
jgi:hypothetical protein